MKKNSSGIKRRKYDASFKEEVLQMIRNGRPVLFDHLSSQYQGLCVRCHSWEKYNGGSLRALLQSAQR